MPLIACRTQKTRIGHIECERNQEGDQSEKNVVSTITGTTSLSPQANVTPANGYSAWDFELNSNSTATLNLMQKFTQERGNRVAFMHW